MLKLRFTGGLATAHHHVPKEAKSALESRLEVDMKRVGAALLVIVLQASASGRGSPDDPNTNSKICQQAERYFDAIDRADVKVLDALLVEECLLFYPRGVVDTKATLLEALRKRNPADWSVPTNRTLDDVKVRCVGHTAPPSVATHPRSVINGP